MSGNRKKKENNKMSKPFRRNIAKQTSKGISKQSTPASEAGPSVLMAVLTKYCLICNQVKIVKQSSENDKDKIVENKKSQRKQDILFKFLFRHLLEVPEKELSDGWEDDSFHGASNASQDLYLCSNCSRKIKNTREIHKTMIECANKIKNSQKKILEEMKRTTKNIKNKNEVRKRKNKFVSNLKQFVNQKNYETTIGSLFLNSEDYRDEKKVIENKGSSVVNTSNLENGYKEREASVSSSLQSGRGFMEEDSSDMTVETVNMSNQQNGGTSSNGRNVLTNKRCKRHRRPNGYYTELEEEEKSETEIKEKKENPGQKRKIRVKRWRCKRCGISFLAKVLRDEHLRQKHDKISSGQDGLLYCNRK